MHPPPMNFHRITSRPFHGNFKCGSGRTFLGMIQTRSDGLGTNYRSNRDIFYGMQDELSPTISRRMRPLYSVVGVCWNWELEQAYQA